MLLVAGRLLLVARFIDVCKNKKCHAESILFVIQQRLMDDALEAILNADYLTRKKSTSQDKVMPKEMVYIIESYTYDGILMYIKGIIRKSGNQEEFYIIISAKRSTFEG